MRRYHENIDEDYQRIVDALLNNPTKEAAAKALGISRATLYRWLQDEDLRNLEREAREMALSDATASVHRLANEAALTLSVIMKSDAAPYSSRVAAASKLLDLAYRAYETEAIVDELTQLKQDLNL
jgi:hypothetical protein